MNAKKKTEKCIKVDWVSGWDWDGGGDWGHLGLEMEQGISLWWGLGQDKRWGGDCG